MFLFIVNLVILSLVSILELTNWSFIGLVKPDLSLVLIIFLSLTYKDWLKRSILILLAAVVFKFGAGFELGSILFIASSLIGIVIVEKLPGSQLINLFVGVFIATLVMNIMGFGLTTFLLELAYNLLALLVYYSVYKLWPK